MRKIYISVLAVILFSFKTFDSSTHSLAGGSFIQDWTNTGLITVNDDWSGVTSIVGFLGQDITTTTGINPQTLTGVSAVAADADVIANQTTPNTLTNGGVAEFQITNPTIALNGSGTADAPHIIIYLNSSGRSNINVSYLLRDLDGSADNSIQPVALQYRIGNAGSFINVPAAFVADATSGPSLATLETQVNVVLPAACDNQSEVQVRIITANAVGNDEWVGIDNINISSDATASTTASASAGVNAAEPSTNGTFIINLSSPAPAGGIVVTYSLTGSATIISDYTNPQAGTVTIAENTSSATVNINVNDDADIEGTESVQINLISATSPVTIGTASATINISDNDFPPNPYISLVNTYSQDFNSLANTGTTNSLSITGWILNETGGSARDNEQYGADNGGSNTGDAYSYGTTATTDRALGGLQSGTLIPTFGAQIQNNSGTTITKLKISYTGEEWRLGTISRTDKLSFQYSTNATSLTNGTWVDVSALDFITPNITTAGAKDGNNAAFRTSLVYTLRNLSISNGSVFLIRWNDFNASGADDGLAVDDFSIEVNPIDLTPPAIVSLTPANNATNLPINISASVQFNEDVLKGTGNIRLRRTSDNSIYQTIDINSVAVTVAASTIQIAVNALAVNTQYYFEIDNGSITDLDGNPFAGISGNNTWTFTTGINFYVANFQTCTSGLTDGFTQYSVTGAIVWACTSFGRDPSAPAGTAAFPNAVQINGFANGTNVPNVDWLISPSFNLTGTNYPLLSFWSRTAFNGQPLQLKVSTDYISGDPTLATWTDINGKFPAQTSNIWTFSENINLSAFKQSNVHFAFVYVSDDDEGARWTLDDISLGNSPTPPPPSLTVSTNDIQFAFAASGTTADKQFSLTGNDLLNGITLNATGVFSLSKDGVSFSTSLNYTVAEANNNSKTVYVRFAPTQNNQNFTGTVLIGSGILTETINLSGSSIDPSTTLEVVNWNIEWFGSSANGPANDVQQEQNVKTILQDLNADVYAVSEIVSEQRLASVVSQMPGYAYVISNYGSHTNTSVNPVGALAEAQKLAFVYKTSVLSNISTTALVSAGINTAADIANPAYNYFASGRFPFMLSADVTLNCITKNVKFVLIHGKANTSPTATSYDRRKRGSDTLRYTLQQNYANDNVIILGDYNDDLDFTITAGINPPVTSYSAFTTDAVNFTALTLPLSLAGKKSTVSFNDVIDHVVASNDMATYYMPATASILSDVTSLVSNYSGTTSDHYPVFTRYIFENKIAPVVSYCPVVSPLCTSTTNIFAIPLFTATDDCDAITYSFEITGATQRTGYTNNASGLFNAGTSTITWTATDNWGNTATCQTTVVVNISPSSVTIPDTYALPSGVLANTVYIGYSPASSLTLTSVVTGGTPSYTYNWSNGSTASSVTVNPVVTTTYTLTVTDANGCQATGSKTVNVIDIRGGNKNDKVTICHNSNSLVVSGSSIIAHLAHGDMLGSCNAASKFITTKSIDVENTEILKIALAAMPNPTLSGFTITAVTTNTNDRISLRVTDVIGRTIELRNNLQPYQAIKIGDRYHSGIYFAEVMQGNLKKVIKLVKL